MTRRDLFATLAGAAIAQAAPAPKVLDFSRAAFSSPETLNAWWLWERLIEEIKVTPDFVNSDAAIAIARHQQRRITERAW